MTVCLKVRPAPRPVTKARRFNAVSAVLALAVRVVEEVGPALVQAARVRSWGAPSLQRSFNHFIRSRQQRGRNL